MKIFTTLIKSLALSLILAVPGYASSIYLSGDSNIFTTAEDNEIFFQNVFNGKTVANYSSRSLGGLGTTATETNYGTGATVTSAGLGANDFMIFGYARTSVSASELTAISNYVSGGGSLFLFGEGNTSFTSLNNAVNAILGAVGSSMSLSTTLNLDLGGQNIQPLQNLVTTGSQTIGVNSWYTAYASLINLGSGTALISGTGNDGVTGAAIAVEVSAVPVPAAFPLLLAALGGLGLVGRRRKAS